MSNCDERLREEIESIGVSKLAKSLGVARNTLYNWVEKGNVPMDKLLALGKEGLDVVYILTGQRSIPTSTLNKREEALLDNYRNTNEQGQRALESTASAFAQSATQKQAANGG